MLPKVGKNGPMLTLDNVSSVDATRSQSTRHRDRLPGQAQMKRLIQSQQSQRRIASQKQRRIRKTLSDDIITPTLFGGPAVATFDATVDIEAAAAILRI